MNEHEQWVLEWIKKGDADYKTAKVLFDSGEPLYDAICFHCQQCAEKYLKAYLIYMGKPVSKTHDLEKIRNACAELNHEFEGLKHPCFILNDYAVEVRYPDDYVEIAKEEADKAIDHASEIRDFVRAKIEFLKI